MEEGGYVVSRYSSLTSCLCSWKAKMLEEGVLEGWEF